AAPLRATSVTKRRRFIVLDGSGMAVSSALAGARGSAQRPEVLDRNRLKRLGGLEAEHTRVEEELGFEGAADRLPAAEPVSLVLEREIRIRRAPFLERPHHHVGLLRRADDVLRSLKEDHGDLDPIGRVDGRALAIDVDARGIRPDQPLRVLPFELVLVAARQDLEIPDAEIARSRAEDPPRLERAEGGVAAGAPAPDRDTRGIGKP